MIDPKNLRDNLDKIIDMLDKRNVKFPLNDLIKLDKKRRELIANLQLERHKKNNIANIIAVKKKKNEDISTYIKQMEDTGKRIKLLEENVYGNNSKFYSLIMLLPNYVHDSVPVGKDQTNNVIIRTHGTLKKFDHTIRNHIDIGESLDLIDIEKAQKYLDHDFIFKNDLVKLNHAIISFALDFLCEKGYTLLQPPI
jgi:seryl-tRNA synthetase